jgi:hypothetical protein
LTSADAYKIPSEVRITEQNHPVTVPVAKLLQNASPLGDPLSINQVNTITTGASVIEASGFVTYTPPSGFTGSDSFTYTLDDSLTDCTAQGTVEVNVITGHTPTQPNTLGTPLVATCVNLELLGTPNHAYALLWAQSTNGPWSGRGETFLATLLANPVTGLVIYSDCNPVPSAGFYQIISGRCPRIVKHHIKVGIACSLHRNKSQYQIAMVF